MEAVELRASLRSTGTKGGVKRFRKAGLVPAVAYRGGQKPVSLVIDAREFGKLIRAEGENALVQLCIRGEAAAPAPAKSFQRQELSGKGEPQIKFSMIRDVQRHPVDDSVLHVDFQEVSMTETIHAAVSIKEFGEPEGVKKDGGILEQLLWELEVSCRAQDLPEEIEVDVSSLQLEDAIHVSELKLPDGVTALTAPETVVFVVKPPQKEEVVEPTAEAPTAQEPEVLKQKPEEASSET